MNDEIKEILKKLKSVANRETSSRNALMEMKDKDYQLLLNYITNLQQRIDKAIEYIEENKQLSMFADLRKSGVSNYDLECDADDLLDILKGDSDV